jgi:hypothetical protein
MVENFIIPEKFLPGADPWGVIFYPLAICPGERNFIM